jgi:hypothetical protein
MCSEKAFLGSPSGQSTGFSAVPFIISRDGGGETVQVEDLSLSLWCCVSVTYRLRTRGKFRHIRQQGKPHNAKQVVTDGSGFHCTKTTQRKHRSCKSPWKDNVTLRHLIPQYSLLLAPNTDSELLSENQLGCPPAKCSCTTHINGWRMDTSSRWTWDDSGTRMLTPVLGSCQPPWCSYLQGFKIEHDIHWQSMGLASFLSRLALTDVCPRFWRRL